MGADLKAGERGKGAPPVRQLLATVVAAMMLAAYGTSGALPTPSPTNGTNGHAQCGAYSVAEPDRAAILAAAYALPDVAGSAAAAAIQPADGNHHHGDEATLSRHLAEMRYPSSVQSSLRRSFAARSTSASASVAPVPSIWGGSWRSLAGHGPLAHTAQ